MNNYLVRLDHFRSVKAVKAEELKAIEAELDAVYKDCDSLKKRVETRKNSEAVLDDICSRMNEKNNEIKILDNCIKVAQEMIAKEAANKLIVAFKAGEKNLLNVPTHYKKFKNAVEKVLGEAGGYISHHYYTMTYYTPYYSPAGIQEIYILTTENEGGPVTPEAVEKTKPFDLIPVEDIEAAVIKAMQAKKAIEEIEKKAKAEIDAIKAENNACDAIYNILR